MEIPVIILQVLNIVLSTIVPPLSGFIQKISSSKCVGCDLRREETQESLVLNEIRDIKMLLLSERRHSAFPDQKIENILEP